MKSRKVTIWSALVKCQAIDVDVRKKSLEIAGLDESGTIYRANLITPLGRLAALSTVWPGSRFKERLSARRRGITI
jgi:hypothetical protein